VPYMRQIYLLEHYFTGGQSRECRQFYLRWDEMKWSNEHIPKYIFWRTYGTLRHLGIYFNCALEAFEKTLLLLIPAASKVGMKNITGF
jgi:hypothetical protein